jgi:hypothetical protein
MRIASCVSTQFLSPFLLLPAERNALRCVNSLLMRFCACTEDMQQRPAQKTALAGFGASLAGDNGPFVTAV